MRSISYRAKLRLRKILKYSVLVLAILLVISIVGFVYLERFLVYTPDGVRFDFQRSQEPLHLENSTEPSQQTVPSVTVIFNEATPDISEDQAFTGYYIDISMLQDPDAVYQAVCALEEPAVIMIDLKSSSGMFYYSTGIDGAVPAEIDISTVDAILAHLRTNGFPVIARVEAFRDRAYALAHQSYGLAIKGGALWSDEGYYWLDPGEEAVLEYLQQIAKELSSRGITEIVFDDFYFPGSSSIIYKHEASRTDLINSTAESLLSSFKNTNIKISFGGTATDFQISEKQSHIIVEDADASKVNSVLASYSHLPDAQAQLVFLTNSKDTRFDGYNLLRPLIQK